MSIKIAVRQLAEFVFRQGDLYPTRQARGVDAREGIETQEKIQNQRKALLPVFEAEVPIALDVDLALGAGRLAGRIDGLIRNDNGPWRIEEYKATRDPQAALNPVHWGQCILYAALIARQYGLEELLVAVVYVHPESLREQFFEQRIAADYAIQCLALALLCFDVRQHRHHLRCAQRDQWMQRCEFPFPHYRKSQKAIARQVYRSIRDGEHLLLEATTGAGKSVATLYPALKQMAVAQRLFFLTSKTSGADAALKAAAQIAGESQELCVIQITAREKVCMEREAPCDPQACSRCRNYHARAPYAVNKLLTMGVVDRACIERVATEFRVCPFELSLDAALWADVIIGDYNYVFDPFVRLQRFADASQSLLLVDEAHQLGTRVVEMLTAELLLDLNLQPDVRLGKEFNQAINKLFRAAKSLLPNPKVPLPTQLQSTKALEQTAEKFLQCIDELELFDLLDDDTKALYFACYRWVRSLEWYQPERYRLLVDVNQTGVCVKRYCLDAGDYINAVLQTHAASIRFSGTVSPLELYQRLHGRKDQAFVRAESPFQPQQSAVLVIKDVPTYYRQRNQSLAMLSELLDSMLQEAPGRYLVGFPSYAYLDAFSQQHRPLNYSYLSQQQGADIDALRRQRQQFEQDAQTVMGVVLGGSLSESVEFVNAPLSGIIIVGIGLPPPSLERDLTARYFDRSQGIGWGQMVAYHQPALTKVVQMAGRLLRSERDRGVICLVDERFQQRQVQSFFPVHWQIQNIPSKQLKGALKAFWNMTQQGSASKLDR